MSTPATTRFMQNMEAGVFPAFYVKTTPSQRNITISMMAISITCMLGGVLLVTLAESCGGAALTGTAIFAPGIVVLIVGGIGGTWITVRRLRNQANHIVDGLDLRGKEPIQPIKQYGRYIHGLEKKSWCGVTYEIVGQTIENIISIRQGGFRDYTPPEPLTELYGPTQVNPQSKNQVELTFGGHASFNIRACHKGQVTSLITDCNDAQTVPFFGDIPLYYRATPPGYVTAGNTTYNALTTPPTVLGQVNGLILSHNHGDHRGNTTIEQLHTANPQMSMIGPSGSHDEFASMGINVTGLSWWESRDIGDIRVHAVPADHSSQTKLTNCQEDLWCNWVVQIPLTKTGASEEEMYTIWFVTDSAWNLVPETPGFVPERWALDTTICCNVLQRFPKIDALCIGLDPIADQTDLHADLLQNRDLIDIVNAMRIKTLASEGKENESPLVVIPCHYGTWPFNDLDPKDNGKLLTPLREFTRLFQEWFPASATNPVAYPIKAGERIVLANKEGGKCMRSITDDIGEADEARRDADSDSEKTDDDTVLV